VNDQAAETVYAEVRDRLDKYERVRAWFKDNG
jgi:hypothetical protein